MTWFRMPQRPDVTCAPGFGRAQCSDSMIEDLYIYLTCDKCGARQRVYNGDPNDSAAMNIWLHKALLKKLNENGGKVPADLLD